MTRIRVLHFTMELTDSLVSIRGKTLLNQRVGKIDRSAEALRVSHHPFILSLRKYNPATTLRE
jgi:hypothetical protein